MGSTATTPRSLVLAVLAASVVQTGAAASGQTRGIPPGTVEMAMPEALGPMERPAVEFDHGLHTAALEAQGCEVCHPIKEEKLSPKLTRTTDIDDRDSLIDAFHAACTGCHTERAQAGTKGGPVTCGECHVRRPPGESTRVEMAYDYSLHARHAQAYPEKCDTCHHVYDEVQQKLVYQKGTEEACRSCHGAVDVDKTPSLENASHRDCVGCHLDRVENELEGGPVLCVGCHDADARHGIELLEEVPRLVCGQPDTTWIQAAGAASKLVAFDHLAHEPRTSSCSSCHHRTLKECDDCHTLGGAEEGAGVTLVQAYHLSSSEYSCVGCHSITARHRDCSGCHRKISRPPGEQACTVCHSGPQPGPEPIETAPTVSDRVVLAALPVPSDEFPEMVAIESLVEQYEPSTLPHAKVVGKLHSSIVDSALAGRFHGTTEAMCVGCHHNSPVGMRPPPCRSCHGELNEATGDKPTLKVAYHRHCVGCHQAMGIAKQGCTDCHAAREVQR